MSLLLGCSRGESSEGIMVDYSASTSSLVDAVESVSLLPLKEDEGHLLGEKVELYLLGDSYIIMDQLNTRIYRFSSNNGEFVCEIGTKGNGPGEYSSIKNIQVRDDKVVVFSDPDKILTYDKNGTLIHEEHVPDLGLQNIYVKEGLLSFFGAGRGKDNVLYLNDGRQSHGWLDATAKILAMSPDFPVFYESGDNVYFTDLYNPSIYRYSNGSVDCYATLDFGKYAIKDDFFHFDNSMQAAQFLLSSDFGLVRRAIGDPDGDAFMVETMIQKAPSPSYVYGLKLGDSWKWFRIDEKNEPALFGSFRQIEGGTIYCILNSVILSDSKPLLGKVSRKDQEEACKGDGWVVAKLCLR